MFAFTNLITEDHLTSSQARPELEKVLNVPSIQNQTYTMFLKFLPLLTKSAEEIFY